MATGAEIRITGYSSKWRKDCDDLLKSLGEIGLVAGEDYDLIDGGARNSPVFPCLVVKPQNSCNLPPVRIRGLDSVLDYLHAHLEQIRAVR